MVADLSSTPTTPKSKVILSPAAKPRRAPLGSDNNGRSLQRRPKPKDVTSRYLSYTNSVPVTSPSPVVQSAERRRSPRTVEVKTLTKTSARSLSVSFQVESFALPVSKVGKQVNNNNNNNGLRNGTVSRRSVTAETKLEQNIRDSDYSDTESIISSGSSLGNIRGGGGPRAIVVPARFWQETINLLRRVQVQPPPLLKSNNKPMAISGCKVSLHDGGQKVPPRGIGSSNYGGGGCNNNNNNNSIVSFCGDWKRGKVGEKKIADAHLLRLLHNKHMQWRFANAKVDAAMLLQRAAAQKILYNAWVSISKLWHSVISKRLQMQQLNHNLKLHSLLKKQMLYLDNWDLTDRDHSISLAGAIVALESSSLCVPVLCGAKVDIQNLKDAICSAADVMQAMAVSLYSLVTKAENVNSMASELANAMKTEYSLLDQCKDLLSTLTLLEKQDCSLRAHTLQLIPAATMTQRPKKMPF